MITIEFMGLPGSGKSTAIQHFKKHLRKESLNQVDLMEKYDFPEALFLTNFLTPRIKTIVHQAFFVTISNHFLYLPNFKKNTQSFYNSLNNIFSSKDVVIESSCKRYINQLCGQKILSQKAPDDCYFLLDEGFHHRITSIFGDTAHPPKNLIQNYVDNIPDCNVLVYIKSDIRDSFNRLKVRGLPHRLKGRTDEDIISFLKRNLTLIERMKKSKKSHLFFELSNHSTSDELDTLVKAACLEIDLFFKKKQSHY